MSRYTYTVKLRRAAAVLSCLVLVLSVFSSAGEAFAAGQIRVVLNGQPLYMDTPPQIVQGRTLVPMRAIFEALGATVSWDQPTNTVTAVYGETTIVLPIGKSTVTINGIPTVLDVAALTISGRTMVPLRFIAESLGADVAWVGATNTVDIVHQPATPNTPDIKVPAVFADDENDTILGIDSSMEYCIDDNAFISYDPLNPPDLSGNHMVLVRIHATETTPESSTASLVFTATSTSTSVPLWIYYINSSDQNRLYRIRADGTNRAQMTSDGVYALSIQDDWIYFTSLQDEKLYKVKIDGTERTKISDDECFAGKVSGNWVYYVNDSDGGKLYKIGTDGTGKVKLSDDTPTVHIQVAGDWVYFISIADFNFNLYRIRIDGSGREVMIEDAREAFVADDWIYYVNESDEGKVYKVRTDGTEKTRLTSEPTQSGPIVDGNWAYYAVSNSGFFKALIDGTDIVKLSDNGMVFQQPVPKGDWVFVATDDGLMRMHKDGTNLLKVTDDRLNFGFGFLAVVGPYTLPKPAVSQPIVPDFRNRLGIRIEAHYDTNRLAQYTKVTNNTGERLLNVDFTSVWYNPTTRAVKVFDEYESETIGMNPGEVRQFDNAIPRYQHTTDFDSYICIATLIKGVEHHSTFPYYQKWMVANPEYDNDLAYTTSQSYISNRVKEIQALQTAAMTSLSKELAANNGVPLKIIESKVTYNSIGSPITNLTVKNLTTKKIDAFEIKVSCYDTYGRLVTSFGDTAYYGIMQNIKTDYKGHDAGYIGPGQITTGYWTMYLFENTTRISVQIISVHFTDGTVWKR